MLPISRYSTGVGAIVLLAMPIAQAQTVTTAALTATAASIPVDHPGALLLLVLAVCACGAWLARRTEWGKATLQAWAWSAGALTLVGVVGWSDVARAVLVDLQESFQQAGGETRSVPVQATGTALDGSPIGFMPVVYSNQSSGGLRIVGITAAPWTACFPMGLPASLPVAQPHAGTRCSVGTALPPGSACWVDVAELCALGAADVRGSNPTHVAADSATVAQGASVSGNVLTNDSDADGMLQVTRFVFEGMTYAAGDQAAVAGRGTFTLASGGGYTFQAAPSFTGTNPLVVSYATQTGATSTLSLTVSVPAPINAEPIARDDTATVDENTSVTIAVRANDTDADGDSLVVTGVTQGANGSVVIDAVTGNPIYTPNAGFVGSDTFTYTVTDGRGGISTATVTVTVNPTSGVNHPPVAVDDAFSTAKDVALEIVLANLTANDTDIDGDTLAVFSAGSVVNGSLGYIQSKLHFTPSAGYVGPASFRYSIHDGRGGTSTATVNITVY